MIRNQWYVVLDSSQLKNKPVGIIRMGEKLVFWRDLAGKSVCVSDKCVHRGAQLSKGKIINGHLQCPFHGIEYEASGRVVMIPANGKNALIPEGFQIQSYPTYEANDLIWIWWGDNPPAELKPPRFFDDLDTQFSYVNIYRHWNIHYSRAIENQLDVAHLPFVHQNTIGRGGRTLVDGPGVQWISDDMFIVYIYNRIDDGKPPLKPQEVPIPDPYKDFKIEFILPNLWQNHINENVRILLAFVPVDQENTMLYLRYYQKYIRFPLLRRLVNKLSMLLNSVILNQDRRVVLTQQPQISTLRMGEKLIQADRPIIEYRRKRQELIEENN
jgi:phenylpropionate dioxygenase-like ring-hydroxylating dioxygenase large terminal subunit